MNKSNMFDQYKSEPNLEHWRNFSELMWELGFEMDCYDSAPTVKALDWQFHTEKETQDQLLAEMINWKTQEVGNYIFSRYRELTHWSDYGYPEEKGAYFFERAIPILESMLKSDWEMRHTVPTFRFFSETVGNRFKRSMDESTMKQAEIFLENEGRFHIQNKYNEYVEKSKNEELSIPMFYGMCVSETVFFLKNLF